MSNVSGRDGFAGVPYCSRLSFAIKVRSDMAERMFQNDWALLPTKKMFDAMNALSDYNATTGVHNRKRFTEVSLPNHLSYQKFIASTTWSEHGICA